MPLLYRGAYTGAKRMLRYSLCRTGQDGRTPGLWITFGEPRGSREREWTWATDAARLRAIESNELTELIRLLRWAVHGPPPGEPAGSAPEIRVEGTDSTGLLDVAVIDQARGRVFRLRVPDVNALVALAGPPLRSLRDLPESVLPYASRTGGTLPVAQQATGAEPFAAVMAGPGAQAVASVAAAEGTRMAVAGYTCRGPTQEAQGMEYKPFNEDAVVVRLKRADAARGTPEVAAIGAFDQAGGEGQVADRPGAASGLAAEAFARAVERIEAGEDAQVALREAVRQAGEDVLGLGVGAVTTFAGAVAISGPDGCEAHVAVVGDSRVLRFNKAGELKAATDPHNFGRAVAAGLVEDVPPAMALRFAGVLMRSVGAEPTEPDLYSWKLDPGDRLVVETDGLGDARELEEMPDGVWHADRCAVEQGRIVARTSSVAGAVTALAGYALDQMADGYGKPDNIGVAVLVVSGG